MAETIVLNDGKFVRVLIRESRVRAGNFRSEYSAAESGMEAILHAQKVKHFASLMRHGLEAKLGVDFLAGGVVFAGAQPDAF